jgi:hypothetical protein
MNSTTVLMIDMGVGRKNYMWNMLLLVKCLNFVKNLLSNTNKMSGTKEELVFKCHREVEIKTLPICIHIFEKSLSTNGIRACGLVV